MQKNVSFSHSFPFFSKDCFVLCVYFCSLQKNVSFSAFISVLCKERFVLCVHFRSLEKNVKNALFFWVWQVAKNTKKKCKRTFCSFKERKRTMRSERKRTRCPTLVKLHRLRLWLRAVSHLWIFVGNSFTCALFQQF